MKYGKPPSPGSTPTTFWSLLDLDTPLSELRGVSMLVVGEDRTTAALATIRITNEDRFDSLMHPRDEVPLADYSLTTARVSAPNTLNSVPFPLDTALGTALRHLRIKNMRAIVIPTIHWARRATPFTMEPTRILTAGDLHLDAATIVDYALARVAGERPDPPTSEDRQRATLVANAEAVLTEYGQLLSDIGGQGQCRNARPLTPTPHGPGRRQARRQGGPAGLGCLQRGGTGGGAGTGGAHPRGSWPALPARRPHNAPAHHRLRAWNGTLAAWPGMSLDRAVPSTRTTAG